jgi:hypothetical protein
MAGKSLEHTFMSSRSNFLKQDHSESYKGSILEHQYDQKSEIEIEKNRSQVLKRAMN